MKCVASGYQSISQGFGNTLTDDLTLPDANLSLLFGALLLTAVGVFAASNLLLLDPYTALISAQIMLPCLGLQLVFYAVSRQTRSILWGLLLTYGLLWLLVVGRMELMVPVVYLIFAASGYVAFRYLRIYRKDWPSLILMAVTATTAVLALAMQYTSFDMSARLHNGNVQQDTLFHASIAAMIKNYGVISTGLHGLVETPYHVFSHKLMAAISMTSGLAVIEVYGVANSVLFAPILIFSVAAICGKLDRAHELSIPVVWMLTAVVMVACPFLLGRWALWGSFLVSESYLVALTLLTLGLALLFKRRLSSMDLIAAVLLAAMLANAKASVGLVFAGLWLVRFTFLDSERRSWVLLAALVVALVTGIVVFDSAQASSGSMPVDPLHFVRTYSFLGKHLDTAFETMATGVQSDMRTLVLALVAVLSFFLIHFGASWLVIGRVASRGGLRAIFGSPMALYSLAALGAGAAVVSVFAIGGGSAYYFSNVAFFISLPCLVALLASRLAQRGVTQRRIFIVVMIVVILLGMKSFRSASRLSMGRADPQTSELISHLQVMRLHAPLNVVWAPGPKTGADNPVELCTAQPFVYAAVSERPWTGIVPDGRDGRCQYHAYGYERYGITAANPQITSTPRLLEAMELRIAP